MLSSPLASPSTMGVPVIDVKPVMSSALAKEHRRSYSTAAYKRPDTPKDLAIAHLQKSMSVQPIYEFVMDGAEIQDSTEAGSISAVMQLTERHVDSGGALHGSVSATIVDWASSNALASMGSNSGVSTNMNITFLGKVMAGYKVIIEGKVDRRGRNMAFTRVEMKNALNGALVVTAMHTRFVGGGEGSAAKWETPGWDSVRMSQTKVVPGAV